MQRYPVYRTNQLIWSWAFPINMRSLVFNSPEGSVPNLQDPAGDTLLHAITQWNRRDLAEQLHFRHVSFYNTPLGLNIRNYQGHTAIQSAVIFGSLDMFVWLYQHGATLESQTTLGENIFWIAFCQSGCEIVSGILKSFPQYLSLQDKNLALLAAAAKGYLHLVRSLLEHGAQATFKDANGNNAMAYAQMSGHMEVAKYVYREEVKLYLKSLESDEKRNECLQNAIMSRNKSLLSALLLAGLRPTDAMYQSAPPEIKKFFDYYPGLTRRGWQYKKSLLGRQLSATAIKEDLTAHDIIDEWVIRYPSIRECLEDKQKLQRFLNTRDRDVLADLIDDGGNTTDEESSDEEDDRETIINPLSDADKASRWCLHRGVHFSPKHFNSRQRKQAKSPAYHNADIYSAATASRAQQYSPPSYQNADAEVKNYFATIKNCPAVEERKPDNTKISRTRSFQNNYFQLLHVYVNPNGYNNLFSEAGILRNFHFFDNKNPFLSMTTVRDVAYKYASGERFPEHALLTPRRRKSTEELKHKRIGFIQTYFVDHNFLNQFADDIDRLNKNKDISISGNYSHNYEVIIQSSIPRQYVYSFTMVSASNSPRRDVNINPEYYLVSWMRSMNISKPAAAVPITQVEQPLADKGSNQNVQLPKLVVSTLVDTVSDAAGQRAQVPQRSSAALPTALPQVITPATFIVASEAPLSQSSSIAETARPVTANLPLITASGSASNSEIKNQKREESSPAAILLAGIIKPAAAVKDEQIQRVEYTNALLKN